MGVFHGRILLSRVPAVPANRGQSPIFRGWSIVRFIVAATPLRRYGGDRRQATGYREVISSFETAHPAARTRRTSRSEICCGGNRTQITRRNAHAERKIQNTKPALRRDTHLQVSFPADPNPIVHGAREILGPHLAASPFDCDAASVTAHADADLSLIHI